MKTKVKTSRKKKDLKPRKMIALPEPEQKEIQLSGQINIDPQALIMAAVQQGASIDMMERLLAMRERLRAEQAEIAFREAMAIFQAECPIIIKSNGVDYNSKRGSRVKYNYAPLDVIVAKIKDVLSKHGFSYTFTTEQSEKSVTVICHAHHIAGHTETTSVIIPIDSESFMNPAQTVASSLTYAKRYAFCNAFGIMTGDEDNDAMTGGKVQIEDQKVKEEKEKKRQEAIEKIEALPDYIKKGFEILGYNNSNIYMFCDRFGWGKEYHAKMKFEIEKIIKAKEAGENFKNNGGTK